MGWIFDLIGEKLPHKNFTVLPNYVTWMDAYTDFCKDPKILINFQDKNLPSYTDFCKVRREYFPQVFVEFKIELKIFKFRRANYCDLGICDQCLGWKKDIYNAKNNPEKHKQLKIQKQKHLSDVLSQREGYEKRISRARNSPKIWGSITLDHTNALYMPMERPIPKSSIHQSR